MSDAIFRQWLMLKSIPRRPRFIDSADLSDILEDNGVKIPRRYIQRDLLRLQELFVSLRLDDTRKPYRWSFDEHAPSHIPGLDPKTAVALRLVDKYLTRALPRGALRGLEGHFKDAEQTLRTAGHAYAAWEKSVRVITRSLPRRAPAVADDVLDAVEQGLSLSHCLLVVYRARRSENKQMELSPLGLVHNDSVSYLVATAGEYSDVRHYALHRMTAASVIDKACSTPRGFDLDKYIADGRFGFALEGGEICIELVFEKNAALAVTESPLSKDQEVKELADGLVRVRASVMDTHQLRAWLLGFGDSIEVRKPLKLRGFMKDVGRALARKHA